MIPFKELSSNDKIVESSQPGVDIEKFPLETKTFLNHFCREHFWLALSSLLVSHKREHTEKVEPEKLSP